MSGCVQFPITASILDRNKSVSLEAVVEMIRVRFQRHADRLEDQPQSKIFSPENTVAAMHKNSI